MTRSLIPWIIFTLTLIMDYYGFSAVKSAFRGHTDQARVIAFIIYWGLTAFVVFYFILGLIYNFRENSTPVTRFMTGIFMGIFVSKLILVLFLLIEDASRFISYLYNLILRPDNELHTSRRQFLDSVFLGMAGLPFIAFVHGMLKTAHNYQLWKIKVPIKDLPSALDGLKIVQISDIHAGSFSDKEPLKKAVELINSLKPDLFFFTGDLVNNKASEYQPFIEVFKEIKASYGQFSILGNHDYGDYINWETPELKLENFQTLKDYHKQSNWDLLCNENRIIEINGEKLALIGVENWGAKMHFTRQGDLKKAYRGIEDIPTKVLLSHDPSHWDAEVRERTTDVQLTLSGHTHGMQFGVENKWFRFSPVQWFYKQWAGLYKEADQHLYVNRGFGYIGYPGRVGIRPEIAELTLVKA
jgi:predicted MPP superfamily phosphohydrolase